MGGLSGLKGIFKGTSGLKNAGSAVGKGGKAVSGSVDDVAKGASKGWFFKTSADGTRSVRTQSKWIMGGVAGATALTPLGPILAGNAGETAGGLVGGLGGGLLGGMGVIPISSSCAVCCIMIIMVMMILATS